MKLKIELNSHIHDICQKAGQKLNTTSYMDFEKSHLLVMHSSIHNLTAANLFGCAIIELIPIR